ncbi:hypothetical protein OSB04_007799 [Centaurea solstitialis]|uniref:Uncharacterized protein n=1 Tax=Centaurea solstitialis TaxID=347529 RepID=A0AA38WSS6_9ASTR|nr:hypothetical protein OSB04_007799 [Centaurea solstitialis]
MLNSNFRSSNWNSGTKHEAGYDAFMTKVRSKKMVRLLLPIDTKKADTTKQPIKSTSGGSNLHRGEMLDIASCYETRIGSCKLLNSTLFLGD